MVQQTALHRYWNNGPVLILVAAFFFTGMGACVKALSPTIPVFEIVFFRSIVSVIILLPILPLMGVSFRANRPSRLIGRALAGSLAICANFYGLGHLDFGDAVVLLLTFPVFVAILSFILLGERPTRRLLWLIGCAWAGIALILHPQLDVVNYAGLIVLLAAVFTALDIISIHLSKRSDHALLIAFYLLVMASLISFPLMLQDFIAPSMNDTLLLIGSGLFGTGAQIMISQAYGLGEVSRLSPLSYISVVLSFALGMIIWDEIPTAFSLIGALIIIICCIFIARIEKTGPVIDE